MARELGKERERDGKTCDGGGGLWAQQRVHLIHSSQARQHWGRQSVRSQVWLHRENIPTVGEISTWEGMFSSKLELCNRLSFDGLLLGTTRHHLGSIWPAFRWHGAVPVVLTLFPHTASLLIVVIYIGTFRRYFALRFKWATIGLHRRVLIVLLFAVRCPHHRCHRHHR